MLKVADETDQLIVAKTYEAEQQHVFSAWEQLDEEQRRALLDQLRGIDFQQLKKLVRLIDAEPKPHGDLAPLPIERAEGERRAALHERGWEALRAGQVACLVVAGGQGTRLGWEAPKGTFPVGPVSGKSLFQLFAEQVLATSRRAGRPVPWLVLTSRENRAATEAYFAEAGRFGLAEDQVWFLEQRELPTVDLRGKLLLQEPWRVATNPNGHGGTFEALRESGALARLREAGVETLFYFQVDNPLCRVADPVFLGAHLEAGAEASTKVVQKTDPAEKIGLLAQRGGRATVVEYTEMSPEQQAAREPDGLLTYRGGNTAIHAFSLAFLQRLVDQGIELDYHLARKAVPCWDPLRGEAVAPTAPNACKFETFIFGLLEQAERHLAWEVERREEFEPLKNKEGPYSPETVRQAQSERARRWLAAAGARVAPGVPCEIGPLTALDPDELREGLSGLDLKPGPAGLAL